MDDDEIKENDDEVENLSNQIVTLRSKIRQFIVDLDQIRVILRHQAEVLHAETRVHAAELFALFLQAFEEVYSPMTLFQQLLSVCSCFINFLFLFRFFCVVFNRGINF
jgi:hypothetical protein